MTEVRNGLRYTKTHEWVKVEGDKARVGITDHAQHELGDMVFVELPKVGQKVKKGAQFAVVESVKAASDVYSPIDGEVVEVNEELSNAPETLNKSPYDEGWIAVLKIADMKQIESLESAESYRKIVESAKH